MDNANNAGTTNAAPDRLVHVVATTGNTIWISPADNSDFTLNADATIPDIFFEFRTEAAGPY
ncbi:hypothetical protein [Cronobacter sakazakii]|uniref:hypothetical protein n=1 Tax=Cronobacter sakazakii TaxID=28141 RepID=UPI0005766A12|nr:hypothetical protein [Cronobacter sakazakii]EKK3986661.1 hypothetical protein [Cronobacter sakazakii]ELY2552162.1 hypothetical protein [Cronobacter sakazakii]ELY6005208.1 hypothetical protein [Cronobacter sakazakii]ELY6402742.1 hypothetical protein [Cronobacter sakazakii]MBF4817269.1 hypothetical protein [Cronobacter sakazakii]